MSLTNKWPDCPSCADLRARLERAETRQRNPLFIPPHEDCVGCGRCGHADGKTPHGPGCGAKRIGVLQQRLDAMQEEKEALRADRDEARRERDEE